MAETLDYLEGAREEADRALALYGKSTDPLAGLVVAQVATAQALIALVERLDWIIDNDYQDSGQPVLMIGSPFKL